MKKMVAISLAPWLVLLAQTGCGSSNSLSKEEAQQATTVVFSTAFQGTAVAEEERPVDSGETEFSVSESCLQGGNLQYAGTLTLEEELFAFGFEVSFEACGNGNIVTDGVIAFEGSFSETEVSLSMSGELSFSGQIEGSCEIDLGGNMNSATQEVAFSGTMCGFELNELGAATGL